MSQAPKSKESILDLKKHLGKGVTVKFTGGREVTGTLRGFDPLVNLVLEDCIETLRENFSSEQIIVEKIREYFNLGSTFVLSAIKDPDDPYRMTDETRKLGIVVCRGSSVMMLNPVEGSEEIANPFASEVTDQRIDD